MVSPFSHLETGMLKSPSLSDCIIVEGKGDNECESCGKYKSFEPMEAIVIICMWQEAAISAENFLEPCPNLQNRCICTYLVWFCLKRFMSQHFIHVSGHCMDFLNIFVKVPQ